MRRQYLYPSLHKDRQQLRRNNVKLDASATELLHPVIGNLLPGNLSHRLVPSAQNQLTAVPVMTANGFLGLLSLIFTLQLAGRILGLDIDKVRTLPSLLELLVHLIGTDMDIGIVVHTSNLLAVRLDEVYLAVFGS